jgi:ABC-type transporter Mla subunit MlaD
MTTFTAHLNYYALVVVVVVVIIVVVVVVVVNLLQLCKDRRTLKLEIREQLSDGTAGAADLYRHSLGTIN